jgi:hypothetical protein
LLAVHIFDLPLPADTRSAEVQPAEIQESQELAIISSLKRARGNSVPEAESSAKKTKLLSTAMPKMGLLKIDFPQLYALVNEAKAYYRSRCLLDSPYLLKKEKLALAATAHDVMLALTENDTLVATTATTTATTSTATTSTVISTLTTTGMVASAPSRLALTAQVNLLRVKLI